MRRIVFLLEDYNLFYSKQTEELLKNKSSTYETVLADLISKKYYQSDSMAQALTQLGYQAFVIVPEANPLQLQWANENATLTYYKWLFQKPVRSFKSRILKQHRNSYNSIQFDVLFKQLKQINPDVIYFYSNIFITASQLLKLKTIAKKVILQWTCPVWKNYPYQHFDFIITAAIQLREYFNSKRIKCYYLQQAFDDALQNQLKSTNTNTQSDVVFIGNFSLGHILRYETLEYVLQQGINLDIYGSGKNYVPEHSKVNKLLKPGLFGLEMYQRYQHSKMAIHIHTTGIENDGINWNKFAGAKRLFEITGAGTLLLTSHQDNIKDLFEIDQEVVTFKTKEELVQKIKYYLAHPQEAAHIAKAGQQRTLVHHSFRARAKELETFLLSE